MSTKRVAIIGAGIAGLSAGFFLKEKLGNKVEFKIFESKTSCGGTIGVTREQGYTMDWGPNGFLDKEPITLEFIKQLGLTDQLIKANEKSAKRYIYRNEKLWEIAAHPGKFLTNKLLSLPGRLRVLGDIFVSARKDDIDESIYQFACRRIGKEAADILIDPMVTGIFGGDARKLSLTACFPKMAEMENQYGSLIKAMKAKKNEKKDQPVSAGPSGILTSFKGGFYTLIERLSKELNNHIATNSTVQNIQSMDNQYKVQTDDSSDIFDGLIFACPAYATQKLIEPLQSQTASLLSEITYNGLIVVCQGYHRDQIKRSMDGFGFLVPGSQQSLILGSIWTSVIFPDQAPQDHVLLRTMLAGPRKPELLEKSSEELGQITFQELDRIIGLNQPPIIEKVIVWKKAIPQYSLGHNARLETIENNLAALGNIYLAGNSYSGVGLNDVIKRSDHITHLICQSNLLD